MIKITRSDVGRSVKVSDGSIHKIIDFDQSSYGYDLCNHVVKVDHEDVWFRVDGSRGTVDLHIVKFIDVDYMRIPWFLEHFNEGYCICYLNEGIKAGIPIETSDYHIKDLGLAKHIVNLHNNSLQSGFRGTLGGP
jgi:hypothetical protein